MEHKISKAVENPTGTWTLFSRPGEVPFHNFSANPYVMGKYTNATVGTKLEKE